MARTAPNYRSCMDADCNCCEQWQEIADRSLSVAERLARIASILAGKNTYSEGIIRTLQAAEAALAGDNQRLARANKDLNAKNNKIKTVPDKDRVSTGVVGRPPGQKPTINRRPERIDREEAVDIRTCPKDHALSENVTDSYDRVVKVKRVIVENVKYRICRRWCRECKKQYSAKPSSVAPYARVSANHSAIATSLNLNASRTERSPSSAGTPWEGPSRAPGRTATRSAPAAGWPPSTSTSRNRYFWGRTCSATRSGGPSPAPAAPRS